MFSGRDSSSPSPYSPVSPAYSPVEKMYSPRVPATEDPPPRKRRRVIANHGSSFAAAVQSVVSRFRNKHSSVMAEIFVAQSEIAAHEDDKKNAVKDMVLLRKQLAFLKEKDTDDLFSSMKEDMVLTIKDIEARIEEISSLAEKSRKVARKLQRMIPRMESDVALSDKIQALMDGKGVK